MAEVRGARAMWMGNLLQGQGQVSGETTGAFVDLPVSWAARAERVIPGQTSPEELLAAAHASCFSMALAAELGRVGRSPELLDVHCEVTFDRVDGAPTVTSSRLTVRGRVPGLSADDFRRAAEGAGKRCPVSRALAGVAIDVRSELEQEGPQPAAPH